MKPIVMKCDYCKVKVSKETEKCVFAVYRQIINGREYRFCCKNHADEFEKGREK